MAFIGVVVGRSRFREDLVLLPTSSRVPGVLAGRRILSGFGVLFFELRGAGAGKFRPKSTGPILRSPVPLVRAARRCSRSAGICQ